MHESERARSRALRTNIITAIPASSLSLSLAAVSAASISIVAPIYVYAVYILMASRRRFAPRRWLQQHSSVRMARVRTYLRRYYNYIFQKTHTTSTVDETYYKCIYIYIYIYPQAAGNSQFEFFSLPAGGELI